MPAAADLVNTSDAETGKKADKISAAVERERLHVEKIQYKLMEAQEKKWAAEEKDKRRRELFEQQQHLYREKQANRAANKAAENEKLSIGEIEADLVKFLRGEQLYTEPAIRLPKFSHDIRVHKPDHSDDILLYKVEKNTAFPLGKMSAISMLHTYMGNLPGNVAAYNAGMACAKRVMESWMYGSHENNILPHHWGTADYLDLCFNRQDFDLIPCSWDELNRDHPIVTQMFDRLSNPDAVADWLGALLVPGSYRKQSLHLWGKPGGGKSQYNLLLKAFFGPAYRALSNKDLQDPFWRADIEKCRVAVFKEADSNFLNSDEYKDLTGDSDQRINRKYQSAHQAVIDTMFMFVSNPRPTLHGDEGVTDRILLSEVAVIPKEHRLPEEEVGNLMVAAKGSAGGFLRKRYLERYPTKDKIIDRDAVEVRSCIVGRFPAKFEEIFETHFEVKEGSYILGTEFTARLGDSRVVGNEDTLFRTYVAEKYGETVVYKKHKVSRHESKWCWVNLCIKPRPRLFF